MKCYPEDRCHICRKYLSIQENIHALILNEKAGEQAV